MTKTSAGILMCRIRMGILEVLLGHPGGPLWQNRDAGAWSIPKGEVSEGEEVLVAACREFQEETGINAVPPFHPLGSIQQKSGKVVHAWAFAGDCNPHQLKCNLFSLEWPPHSGIVQQYPEIDRWEFFTIDEARSKINQMQMLLLERLNAIYPKEFDRSNRPRQADLF